MSKTLRTALQMDREKFTVPRSVQQTIPIRRIWPDGIFQVGNKFSMSWAFSDINYEVASQAAKQSMFRAFGELINSLDVGAATKITVNNHRVNAERFRRDSLIPLKGDALDGYRQEYNDMLVERATSGSRMLRDRYITVSVHKKNVEEARLTLQRIGAGLERNLSALGSVCEAMDMEERLRVLHDFFRAGNEVGYAFDYRDALRKGHHFADFICPESMEQHADHLMLGGKYARVLYLQSYPAYMRDDIIRELMELPRNMMLSIDYIPVPTDEAVRTVENKLLGVETNITNWQRKQNQNNNFSAAIPYDLNQQRQEANEFLDDLTTRDQRMLHMVLTLVHMADSREELDADTRTLVSTGNKLAYHFSTLRYQQLEGLNTALPYGLRKIDTLRTITTDPAATLTPFHAQEIAHRDGIYHGLSPVSKNMIFINRRQLMNGNGCILGVSGSGKSFFGKLEIVPLLLRGGVDILILDPEREYTSLVEQLGGEVVHISASSPQHINVMDMVRGYGDETNPLVMKSEFILSMFEVLYKQRQELSIRDMSLIDRCVRSVYRDYLRSDYTLQPPTLHDLYNELCAQPEPEGQRIALDVEMFVKGSLNTFAQQTNVDLNSALIAFDIRELDSTLLPLGMLVVLDAIYNRLLRNQRQGRETWIFVDEAYLLFQYPYSANFFYKLWKRIRKQNGFATAITQNVEELLKSDTARLMLANSEYLVLLNQADSDQEELARLLKIPAEQLSYVDNVPQGHGLLKCGSHIVPFEDHFPTDTRLYRMMTTKPSDLYAVQKEEPTHDEPDA